MLFQGQSSLDFRRAVLRALVQGRAKGVNILIVGAPDAGKTFALKPLSEVFKTFIASGQRESYPLQGLPGSELVLLQDVRCPLLPTIFLNLMGWVLCRSAQSP